MSALLFFTFLGLCRAQTDQGTFMLGSDLGSGIINSSSNGLFGLNFGLNDGAGMDLGLSPKMGWFVRDNFLIGAIANIGYSKSPESNSQSSESFVYGLQALTRYYISPDDVDVDELPRRLRFFAEINGGLSGVNVKDGPTTNGFAYGTGPGLAYFITDNVALETTFKYNGLLGAGNTAYQHALSLNLGIQIFLDRNRAENIIDDERRAIN
ncbi:hypothetical protein [Pricia sp.]|uniref:hypothetical protein n=1 Tax=Pricia sp. TaxID=2268138 RepID=UPI003592F9AA